MQSGVLCIIDPPAGERVDPEEMTIVGNIVTTATPYSRGGRRYWTTRPPTFVTLGGQSGEVAIVEHWLRPLRGEAPAPARQLPADVVAA